MAAEGGWRGWSESIGQNTQCTLIKQSFTCHTTVPLTLNLTHACVHTCACTRLTRVKVNNLACIVSAAREFGVRINARGTLDMHDTNTPATCTRMAL